MAKLESHGKHALHTKKADADNVDDDAVDEAGETEAADEPARDSVGEDSSGDAHAKGDMTGPVDEWEPAGDEDDDGLAAFAPAAFIADFEGVPEKKRHGGLKAAGITLGVLVAVVAIVYVAGAVVFMGRFFPNTVIGEYDVSMKTDAEVGEMLDGIVSDYRIDVIGDNFSYRMTGDDIGLSIDSDSIVESMHSDLNAWQWPALILQQRHDETEHLTVTSDRGAYEENLKAAVAKFNESATPPVNATIVFDEAAGEFVVKPEERGTLLNEDAVLVTVSDAIDQLDAKVVLTEENLVQPTIVSTDEDLIEAADLATGMVSAELTLMMGGQEVGKVSGEDLSSFVTINENLEVEFLDEEMTAWVDDLAYSFDTIGTERHFTRADGKQVSVPAGGPYGWEVDSAALKDAVIEGIKAGAKTEIEVPCVQEADVYNGPGERDWGNRYIDVDLSEQYVRFYGDDGSIIWETDCISGSPDGTHDTVPGTWYINNKESPSKLIGYENGKKIYETTVTYWMPFEGNGIGFHDATWQPSFGGSMYANGYGSHGCVNLSYSAAEELYGIVEIGDVVVVHF